MMDRDVAAVMVKLAHLEALLREHEDLHALRFQALCTRLADLEDAIRARRFTPTGLPFDWKARASGARDPAPEG